MRNNMKISVLTILMLQTAMVAFSQQTVQYTQFMFNRSFLNPGATGASGNLCITGLGRHQWIGFKDDNGRAIYPQTYQLSAEVPLFAINSGLGLSFEKDQLGFELNTAFRINYAYHIKIENDHQLSMGLTGDFLSKSIDFGRMDIFDTQDPLLKQSNMGKGSFLDVGAGFYYKFKDDFFAGISALQLTGSPSETGSVVYDRVPHYFLMLGYSFLIVDERDSRLSLLTGMLAKTSTISTQAEVNAILMFNERYWGGLMYRLNDAVGAVAGLKLGNISLGFSYDYTLSNLSKAGSMGSPEILLRYCVPIKQKVKMKGYYNPRYL